MFRLRDSHKTLILLVTIFFLGIFLRTYRIGNSPFGFDQIQIAQEATRISHGDFTLIGPRTGPANMFTGPLIYYIAALFAFVLPAHWSVVASAVFAAIVTGGTIYIVTKRYLDPESALIMTALWAVSPFLVQLDRIPWNPNLTLLASVLTFFPLMRVRSKEGFGVIETLLVSSGIFLGYQAHFSGFLLLPLACLTLLIFLKNKFKLFLIAPVFGLALLATILPTLLFDLKNNWLNVQGFWSLVSDREQVSYYQMFNRLGNKVFIAVETLGKILFHQTSLALVLVAGITATLLSAWLLWKHFKKDSELRTQLQIALVWLVSVVGIFTLYRRPTPEYYFLVLVPVLLLIWTTILRQTFTYHQRWVALKALAVFSVLGLLYTTPKTAAFSLTQQLDAANYVKEIHQQGRLQSVVFDMEPVESLGLQYLLASELASVSSQGAVLHLAYPYHHSHFVSQRFSHNFVAWIDSRHDENSSYIMRDNYILRTQKDWHILEDSNARATQEADESYFVFNEDFDQLGQLLVFDRKLHPEIMSEINTDGPATEAPKSPTFMTTWIRTTAWNQPADVYTDLETVFIFLPSGTENAVGSVDIIRN